MSRIEYEILWEGKWHKVPVELYNNDTIIAGFERRTVGVIDPGPNDWIKKYPRLEKEAFKVTESGYTERVKNPVSGFAAENAAHGFTEGSEIPMSETAKDFINNGKFPRSKKLNEFDDSKVKPSDMRDHYEKTGTLYPNSNGQPSQQTYTRRTPPVSPLTFEAELTTLINKHSRENDSDTLDYILATYILDALHAFTVATRARDKHYKGRS